MFVAIQKIKVGEHIEQQITEEGVIEVIVPDYEEHKSFVAETREKLEEMQESGIVQFERIDEYDYAEMYAGNIYTDRTECVNAKNEAIRKTRESLYNQEIDSLHAQRQRKTITGEWTEADEAEYVARVKELSEKIREENPYVE